MRKDDVDIRPPDHPPGSDQAGFGLVEAMVAILVLSVGLIAVAGITLAVAQQSRASTYTTEQTMVGQEVMESYLDEGFGGLTAGSTDSTVAVGPRTYDLEIVVTDVGPRARRVELSVSGQENTGAVSLSSLVHKPRPVPEEYEP